MQNTIAGSRRAEMVDENREVLADNRGWDVDDLIGFRIELDEALELWIVRSVAEDSTIVLQLLLLLGRIAVDGPPSHTRIEDDIDVAVIVPEETETSTGLDGVAFLILDLDRKQGRAATIEDTHDDRFRQVLDHGLGEPERFENPVGDFIFLE